MNFYGIYRVLRRFSLCFSKFQKVLWVLSSFRWVSQGSPPFSSVLLDFMGSLELHLGFTGFYHRLPSFASLGFNP